MTLSEMSGANFSDCGKYRSLLWRRWDTSKPILNMVMCNPSVAGAVDSDPTVTRQIERAKLLGCGSLLVTNAFDVIATDPKDMKAHPLPCSAQNNEAILTAAKQAVESGGQVIAAWGPNAKHKRRHEEMIKLLRDIPLYALVITKDGICGHPLYVAYQAIPQRYVA